ncbi:hypothetical protein ACWIE7_18060 [Dietzia sp. NPDC055343]
MSENRRKMVALGAAALMALSGLTIGTATASAQDNSSECRTSQEVKVRPVAVNYTLKKEVVGNGTAAPGGTVTFRTTVSGPGALVTRIDDFHPEGFVLLGARESVWKLLGSQSWSNVSDDVRVNAANNSVYRESSGWTTAGGAYVTLETTYRVPDNAKVGDKLNTGAGTTLALANGRQVVNPINTCVTIRQPNAAESVTGSLDGLGLGSVTSGSTAAGGISSDPATFSSDIINGIDIGQLIGLS